MNGYVFADSWFFLALMNPNDRGHPAARAWATDRPGPLLTTNAVVTEVLDALASPRHRVQAAENLARILAAPGTRLIPISADIFSRSLARYQAFGDKSWGFTDCTSMIVMLDEGITDILTADAHFHQAGFNAVFR